MPGLFCRKNNCINICFSLTKINIFHYAIKWLFLIFKDDICLIFQRPVDYEIKYDVIILFSDYFFHVFMHE